MNRRATIALMLILAFVATACADDFDRLDGVTLAGVPQAVKPRERITVEELGNLPYALAGSHSPTLVVVTDQGNFARLQVVAGLRKPPGSTAEPAPILVVERYAAFEAPKGDRRLSRGRDLALFAGFGLDLDTGQVVPAGQGADVKLDSEGTTLVAIGSSRIYPLTISPPFLNDVKTPKTAGRTVQPADYDGRYRLYGDGRWSGLLELSTEGRELRGTFRSDETGASYKLTGRVGEPLPVATFAVDLPRAKLEFTGRLFAEGKGAIAGTVGLLDRVGGFFAVREGKRLVAEEEPSAAPIEVIVLGGRPGRYRIAGKDVEAGDLATSLRGAVAGGAATHVQLKMSADLAYGALIAAREAVRGAVDLPVRDAPTQVEVDK